MSDSKLLLFRLPKSLLIQFLSGWLDIHDVGRLDVAMTNKKHRPDFLHCLKEMRNPSVPVNFPSLYELDQNDFQAALAAFRQSGKTLCVGDSFGAASQGPRKPSKNATLLTWISNREINLEALSLSFSSNKEIIESLHLPSVQKLSINGCPSYGDTSSLRYIPYLCPSLEELKVGYDGLSVYSRAIMEDLIFVFSQCSHLRNVSIESLSFGRDWVGRRNDLLAEFQKFGHLIIEIGEICGYDSNVATESVLNFLKCCSRLNKLRFRDFRDGEKLLMCAPSCPLLEEVRFNRCTKQGLLEISRHCKLLRKVNSFGAVMSASSLEVLKQIDSLDELDLFCCGLTNEKLAVISGFQHIKHLKLKEHDGIYGLTGAGFGVLKGSPISETLESISVSFQTGGDDFLPVRGFDITGMMAGIATCHNLRKAKLSRHCDNDSMAVLGVGCPLLEEVHLTYGPVTVDGLVDLAEHCQHLTKVVLTYDYDQGRDFHAEWGVYIDGSERGPGYARAVADIPIIKKRLPHIQFECVDGFDLDVVDNDDDDEEEEDDDEEEEEVWETTEDEGDGDVADAK